MIVIIDYNAGNLASVKNALDTLCIQNTISNKKRDIQNADVLILPGVGAAGVGMESLRKNKLDKTIRNEVQNGKPFLGICLGMQLLFEQSEEGNVKCLNILKGDVKRFAPTVKIPQIGWNNVRFQKKELSSGITNDSYFYFVNSYYCMPADAKSIIGVTTYGNKFSSIVVQSNIVGVQFHPEKSGPVGFQLLKNIFDYFKERRIYDSKTYYPMS